MADHAPAHKQPHVQQIEHHKAEQCNDPELRMVSEVALRLAPEAVRFDPLQYTAGYDDLIEAFGRDRDAASTHFIERGLAERRSPDRFDAEQYLDNYADLRAAFGDDENAATIHYITSGYDEGRTDDRLAGPRGSEDFLL